VEVGHDHRQRPESERRKQDATYNVPISAHGAVQRRRKPGELSNLPFQGAGGKQGHRFLVATFGRSREQRRNRFGSFRFMPFPEIR
jgi:hypothetical protein